MLLENQVVSLDLAKRLKKLGFKQESLFWWQKWTQGEWKLNHYSDFNGINRNGQIEINGLDIIRDIANDTDDACSAYTVAELGEMLLDGIMTIKTAMPEGFICIHANTVEQHREYDLTEADARAKMLIYLKENNLI